MAPPHEDWIALVAAVEKGDKRALLKLTTLVTGHLTRLGAYRIRGSWDDLCQEVLISLIRSVRKGVIREPRAFVSYAGTITRNRLTDWMRQTARRGVSDDGVDLDARAGRGADREHETYVDLERAVRVLPEKVRRVIEAIYVQGHSYDEAAERLGMPLGTLKRLQTQGLRTLRVEMEVRARRA